MATLNSLTAAILETLLRSQSSLTAREIGHQLGISPRMVRYRLPWIASWLREAGIDLHNRPRYGIHLNASPHMRSIVLKQVEAFNSRPLLPRRAARHHVLLLYLLTRNEPIIISRLEQIVQVSRSTVLRDLDVVQHWLADHQLELLRRPHFGLRVVGKEYNRREAIVSLLQSAVAQPYLLSLLGGPTAPSGMKEGRLIPLVRTFPSFWHSLELFYASKLITSSEEALKLQFSDDSHVALALHLAILIQSVLQGNHIDVSERDIENLQQREEFRVARHVASRIEHRFDVMLTESEMAWIALLLLGRRPTRAMSDLAQQSGRAEDIALEVRSTVDAMLSLASSHLHPALRVDQELMHHLAFHLESVFEQLRFDISIRNPLLDDVKDRYPYIFEVAKRSVQVLEERVGKQVPEAEIGLIAMHYAAAMERLRRPPGAKTRVLVICHAGVATAWLLVSRLRAEFPGIDIVAVMPALDLQRQPSLADADIIVSTIPLQSHDLRTVVVTPFLDDDDIARLQQALALEQASARAGWDAPKRGLRQPALAELLTRDTVRVKVAASSWQEVVYHAGRLLLNSKAVERRYVEAMIDVIREHGPYMVAWPGVSLLHALPEDGVLSLGMSLVTLKAPVRFGHEEHDPVDLVIALSTADGRSHLRALAELQALLEDAQALEKIRAAVAPSQVVDVIASHAAAPTQR